MALKKMKDSQCSTLNLPPIRAHLPGVLFSDPEGDFDLSRIKHGPLECEPYTIMTVLTVSYDFYSLITLFLLVAFYDTEEI